MNSYLSNISKARTQLAKANSITEVLDIRDKAEAIRVYIKAAGEGLDSQNLAAEIKLRAERKAGELLAEMEKNTGNKNRGQSGGNKVLPPRLEELGISKMQAHRWQKEALVDECTFETLIAECMDERKELTQSALLSVANAGHVSQSTGENEWYTPPIYIDAARSAMNGIDLDPASSKLAQEIVKAGTYYSIDIDGLSKPWFGNIWLNPPYSKDLIGRFTERLRIAFEDSQVPQAVVLVNNATETAWFQKLASVASAFCFCSGRIKFNNRNGVPANSPLQGQCFIYLGDGGDRFCSIFDEFGFCASRCQTQT
jgi:hypothetical protein